MQPMNMEITSTFHDVQGACLKVLKKCTKLCTFGSERDIECTVCHVTTGNAHSPIHSTKALNYIPASLGLDGL